MTERPPITTAEIRDYLEKIKGQQTSLSAIRSEFGIERGTKSFDAVRNIMWQLSDQAVVKPVGKVGGVFKVIKKAEPVKVFSVPRERKPPFPLKFPRDRDTQLEIGFAEHVVIREGDCILIAGQSNFGKTTIALNFLAENIDLNPVLLGNEFTKDDEPSPRFLNRLDAINWVEWVDDKGEDKFTLLPVWQDFAENVIKGRINIIDWINLPGEFYMISSVMQDIKEAIGKGIAVPVLQKNESKEWGRGGEPTKDFADLELLIDRHGTHESRITVGKVKESTATVSGRSWAFGISKGVKIINVREVKKCPHCYGRGYTNRGECDSCIGVKYVNV